MAEHIAMTASVLHEDSFLEDGDGFITMSFILPNKYYLEKAPQPLDIRIKLQQKNTHLVATRPFSGLREESKIQKYETELRTWLNQYGSYKPADSLQIAVYDGPVTIPFLRKSEIHIDLKMMN